jgi:2-hydroxychromene-2-carboxylate isomerase
MVARSGAQEITAAYEQNRQDALAADVFGSPVYVLEGEVFRGQDRLELRGRCVEVRPRAL